MGKPTLQEISSLPDPLFSDNFRVEIQSLPASNIVNTLLDLFFGKGTGKAIDNFMGKFSITDAGTALSFHCKTANLPAKTIEPSVVELYGHKLKYAGLSTFSGTFNVEFHEDQNLVVTRTLHAWMNIAKFHQTQSGHYKSQNSTGILIARGSTGGYASNIKLRVYDTTGKETGAFNIVNAWPSEISDVTFDGSAANPVTVSASFCFDMWEEAALGD